MQGINTKLKKIKKRIVFADGEDENTLKLQLHLKIVRNPIWLGKKKLSNRN